MNSIILRISNLETLLRLMNTKIYVNHWNNSCFHYNKQVILMLTVMQFPSIENQPILLQCLHNLHITIDVHSSPSFYYLLLLFLLHSSSLHSFLDLLRSSNPHTLEGHDDGVVTSNMGSLDFSLSNHNSYYHSQCSIIDLFSSKSCRSIRLQ